MRQVNLIGGFYRDEPWAAEDTVNWLPESDDSGQARSETILRGLPGLRVVSFEQGSGGGGGGGGSGGGGIVVSGVVVSGAAPVGVRGAAYSFTFTATGGTGPYLWRLSASVPPGLSINPTTGELSGTPTAGGRYPFVVIAEDSEGLPGVLSLTLIIASAPLTNFPLQNPEFQGAGGWVARRQDATPGFTIDNAAAGQRRSGVVRWQTTAALPVSGFDFGDFYENATAAVLSSPVAAAEMWVRCTAITGATSTDYAFVLLALQGYEDEACTIPIGISARGQEAQFREAGDWRLIFFNRDNLPDSQFFRLQVLFFSSVPATIEADHATWTLDPPTWATRGQP